MQLVSPRYKVLIPDIFETFVTIYMICALATDPSFLSGELFHSIEISFMCTYEVVHNDRTSFLAQGSALVPNFNQMR